MENATNALIMAFSVFFFVMALAIGMHSFNQAKQTSDIILRGQDETNYYEYVEAEGGNAENRIIGMETIIPTLYKYYKENYTVLFRKATYNDDGRFSNIEPFLLYETKTNKNNWGNKKNEHGTGYNTDIGYKDPMKEKYVTYFSSNNYKTWIDNGKIFTFDVEEETLRHEPWTGNEQTYKNLSCFISGGLYINPYYNNPSPSFAQNINYSAFANTNRSKRFVETIAEYQFTTEDEASGITKVKNKRIVIFTCID